MSPQTEELEGLEGTAPHFSGAVTKAQGGEDAGPRQPSTAAPEMGGVCVLLEGGTWFWAHRLSASQPPSRREALGSLLPGILSLLPGLKTWDQGLGSGHTSSVHPSLQMGKPRHRNGGPGASQRRGQCPSPWLDLAPSTPARFPEKLTDATSFITVQTAPHKRSKPPSEGAIHPGPRGRQPAAPAWPILGRLCCREPVQAAPRLAPRHALDAS